MQTCPICTNNQKKNFLCKVNLVMNTEYDLVQCDKCRAIYFNPQPTPLHLKKFYNASYYNFDRWHDEAKGLAYAGKLTKLKHDGRFLDVGCAAGFFIHSIKMHCDWQVYGVDFGQTAIDYAKKNLGLNVQAGDLQNAHYPDDFFDYIHINNVLEHVMDPVALLEECRRIIKQDGQLFLSVPNGCNDSISLIDFYRVEGVPARSVNGHVFFFPVDTLKYLFEKTGLEIESKKTGSIKRGLRNIGYLPKKKNWKRQFFPQDAPEEKKKFEIVVSPKRYPDLYYRYRYFINRLHDIPGLHNFGLDFIFLLRPIA